jgi:hypothetical protein
MYGILGLPAYYGSLPLLSFSSGVRIVTLWVRNKVHVGTTLHRILLHVITGHWLLHCLASCICRVSRGDRVAVIYTPVIDFET